MDDLRKIFEARKSGKKDFCSESKEVLYNNLEKYLKSVMIGSLAAIEEEIGHWWSHNESVELTPEQEKIKDDYGKARKKILDNGNKYLRQIKNELDNYSIILESYKVTLPIIKK